VRLADAVSTRLRAADTGARTITIKVRFSDFVTITRSRSVAVPVTTAKAIADIADGLLASIDVGAGVRLFGISTSGFGEVVEQLTLDDLAGTSAPGRSEADRTEWVSASGAIDAIRERFGTAAIGPASTVSARGLRVVRTGAQQWGPDQQPPPATDA
jgi:DNA polymerase-4